MASVSTTTSKIGISDKQGLSSQTNCANW
jgi:hypothetical protein